MLSVRTNTITAACLCAKCKYVLQYKILEYNFLFEFILKTILAPAPGNLPFPKISETSQLNIERLNPILPIAEEITEFYDGRDNYGIARQVIITTVYKIEIILNKLHI